MWNVELDLSQLDNAALESFLAIPDLPVALWQAIYNRITISAAQ